jgi:hypothetical protein
LGAADHLLVADVHAIEEADGQMHWAGEGG